MVLIILVVVLVIGVLAFIQTPPFGKAPSGERLERIKRSPNFRDGSFQNLSITPQLTEGASMLGLMREFFFSASQRREPGTPIPSMKTDIKQLASSENILVWFGHSSYFLQVDGKKILVDPVFSGHASPVSFSTKSYPGTDRYKPSDFPEIDYLLISHDHWDHLDYETVRQLKPRVKKVITGLGTGAHLEYWGYEAGNIIEQDWYEEILLDSGFSITLTPARHFSGRGFTRNGSLWTSFVLKTPSFGIYIGGDSGYDSHFKKIGDLYGPFDLVLLECGQYDKRWKYIHMLPEEVPMAAEALQAKVLMPVHWSKFTLGMHAWDDPILRVVEASKERKIPIIYPMIGQPVNLEKPETASKWWEQVK